MVDLSVSYAHLRLVVEVLGSMTVPDDGNEARRLLALMIAVAAYVAETTPEIGEMTEDDQ